MDVIVPSFFILRLPPRVAALWERQILHYANCTSWRCMDKDAMQVEFWLRDDTPESRKRLNYAVTPLLRSLDRYRRNR